MNLETVVLTGSLLSLVVVCLWTITAPSVQTGVLGTLGLLGLGISAMYGLESTPCWPRVVAGMALSCVAIVVHTLWVFWRVNRGVPADRRRRTADQVAAVSGQRRRA